MSESPGTSIEARAVRGASWTIAAGFVSRGLGVLGSIAITHFLEPEAVGDVGAAVVLVLTANQVSTIGVGSYIVAKPDEGPPVVFHITVLNLLVGLLALGVVLALAAPLASLFHAPHGAVFVPGIALSVVLDRVGYVPERVMVRQLRFRRIAGVRSTGDIAYTVSSLALAALGMGGAALVAANVIRSALRCVAYVAQVDREEWLRSHPLSVETYRRILRFSVPTWLTTLAEFAASRWDNLIMSYLFGPRVMATYQVAYNLADVPADQIGEQFAEVLLPSFARMDREARKRALISSTGMLAFIVFPVAVGFGAIADTAVALALRPAWASVAPMLTILCMLSIFRPLSWQIGAYLIASDRPRVAMLCSFLKLAVIIGALLTLGRLGPLYACGAVGLGFAASLFAAQLSVANEDGVPVLALLRRLVPPLVACAPMALAVLGVRQALALVAARPAVALPLEILAGVAGYVGGALVLARPMTRELLALVAAARSPRRAHV